MRYLRAKARAGGRCKVKVRHEGVFVVGGIRNVDAFDGILVGERVGDRLLAEVTDAEMVNGIFARRRGGGWSSGQRDRVCGGG